MDSETAVHLDREGATFFFAHVVFFGQLLFSMAGRIVLVRFFFDLCADYSLYEFLPHSAIILWDFMNQSTHGFADRPLAAACFLVACKTLDTKIIDICDLSDAFVTDKEAILDAERKVFELVVFNDISLQPEHMLETLLQTLDCAAIVQRNAVSFFHLSVFGVPPRRGHRRSRVR